MTKALLNMGYMLFDEWERKQRKLKQQKQRIGSKDGRKEKVRTVEPQQLKSGTAHQLRAANRDGTKPAAPSALFEPCNIGGDRDATAA